MNYKELQSLIPYDELHYITDSTQFFKDNDMKLDDNMDILLDHTFVLFENTIDDFAETLYILDRNNIKYTIKTDILNLNYILI